MIPKVNEHSTPAEIQDYNIAMREKHGEKAFQMKKPKRPKGRRLLDDDAPRGDRYYKLYLNAADHRRVGEIVKAEERIPGGNQGSVSALIRHLERVIIQDWGK